MNKYTAIITVNGETLLNEKITIKQATELYEVANRILTKLLKEITGENKS